MKLGQAFYRGDYREALRASTRISPAEHEDFEEEN